MNIHNVSVLFVRVDPGYNATLLLGENLTVNGTLVPAGNMRGRGSLGWTNKPTSHDRFDG